MRSVQSPLFGAKEGNKGRNKASANQLLHSHLFHVINNYSAMYEIASSANARARAALGADPRASSPFPSTAVLLACFVSEFRQRRIKERSSVLRAVDGVVRYASLSRGLTRDKLSRPR